MVNRKRSKAAKEAYARRKEKEMGAAAEQVEQKMADHHFDDDIRPNEELSIKHTDGIDDNASGMTESSNQKEDIMNFSLFEFEAYEKMCQRKSFFPTSSSTLSNNVDKIGRPNNLSKKPLGALPESTKSLPPPSPSSFVSDASLFKTPGKKDLSHFAIPSSVSVRKKKTSSIVTPQHTRNPLSPSKTYTPNVKIGDETMANLMKSSSRMEHLYTPKPRQSQHITHSFSPLTETPAKLIDIDSPNYSFTPGAKGNTSLNEIFTPNSTLSPGKACSLKKSTSGALFTPDVKIGDRTMCNLMKTQGRMQYLYTPKPSSSKNWADALSPLTSETPAKLIDVATPAGPRKSLMFTEDDVNQLTTLLGSVRKTQKQVIHPIKARRSSLGLLDQVSSDLLEFSSITTSHTHE